MDARMDGASGSSTHRFVHELQFVHEWPYRPVHGDLQLDLWHVDLRWQMVLHLRPPQHGHGDCLVDLDIVVR